MSTNSAPTKMQAFLAAKQGDGTEGGADDVLVFHYLTNAGWRMKRLSEKKARLTFGNDPFDAQLKLDDDDIGMVQVVAQRADKYWFLAETGKKDCLTVNGFGRRQAVLSGDCRMVVTIGKIPFIFATGKYAKSGVSMDAAAGKDKQAQTFKINGNDVAFHPKRPFLIGSHELCDFRLDKVFGEHREEEDNKMLFEQPFVASLSVYRNGMFLRRLNSRAPVNLDGIELELETMGLKDGSVIKIGTVQMALELPDPLKAGVEGGLAPEFHEKSFSMIQLDRNRKFLHKLDLPSAGRSLVIGRSADHAQIVLPSLEISRKHAQIILYEKSVLLEDCYSSNGTYVNEERITRRMIRAGDVLSFGNIHYFLCFSDDGLVVP